jgi:hypothetical protein
LGNFAGGYILSLGVSFLRYAVLLSLRRPEFSSLHTLLRFPLDIFQEDFSGMCFSVDTQEQEFYT